MLNIVLIGPFNELPEQDEKYELHRCCELSAPHAYISLGTPKCKNSGDYNDAKEGSRCVRHRTIDQIV